MISSFKQGSYRRHVAVLMSGAAAAQALPIAASPILTRLYTPEDFGLLALYAAIAGILMSVSTAQYELAITLPVKDEDAVSVVSLCIRICIGFSLFLLVIVLLLNERLAQWMGHPEIAGWLYLLPLTILASGLFKTYTFWCNRQSRYGVIARHSFQLSAVTVASGILLGLTSIAGGQIIGILIGRIASAVSMIRTVWKSDKLVLTKSKKALRPMAIRYSAHPIFFMPSRLINQLALQIPIFMISSLFLISTVGYFSVAYRLVALPTSLVANAIGDVYRQRISESYNQTAQYRHIYKRTLFVTLLASIVPFSLLYVITPPLFGFVFGEEWHVAGSYAQILVISTFFSFVTTPLNKGAIVVGAKRYDLIWNVSRFACYVALWAVAYAMSLPIEAVLWGFVFANVCLYCIDAYYQYVLSGGSGEEVDK